MDSDEKCSSPAGPGGEFENPILGNVSVDGTSSALANESQIKAQILAREYCKQAKQRVRSKIRYGYFRPPGMQQ